MENELRHHARVAVRRELRIVAYILAAGAAAGLAATTIIVGDSVGGVIEDAGGVVRSFGDSVKTFGDDLNG